ncbi:MAG TPA: glycosyltransferase family 2 protein [Xanthomonadales bacterium]|nr:glycosyltransferase family 2 protein [Xanthomonadales bacterium]
MKLAAIAMLRNEADIVESFVRHNLRFVDRLYLVDHDSVDATPAILDALKVEGLPIESGRDRASGFRQAERLTNLARRVLAKDGFDFAFVLDADEFIRAPSRTALEAALDATRDEPSRVARWQVHVAADDATGRPLERLRLRVDAPGSRMMAKVVLGREFLADPRLALAPGNHWILEPDGRERGALALEHVFLAHLPFRSVEQFLAKVINGWLAYKLAHGGAAANASAINWHWRTLYDEWLAGREFTASDLRELAIQWYVTVPTPNAPSPSPSKLVDDPIAPCELRYTPSRTDALRALARWSDRLVESVTPAR